MAAGKGNFPGAAYSSGREGGLAVEGSRSEVALDRKSLLLEAVVCDGVGSPGRADVLFTVDSRVLLPVLDDGWVESSSFASQS